MLEGLRSGAISASELLKLHLDRIRRFNPELNAIVTPNFEQAVRRAAAIDADRGTGALEGLPLTIKDTIQVAGLLQTAGVSQWEENVPPENGPVAERVLGAGAVLMGKTNIPPLAADWHSDNEVFGRTVNPWDHGRTPGGSTGGGGAALAAGLTPLEFGSDIGGSIRVPAAFCGVYGHRPSDSVVPRSGHLPGSAVPLPGSIMSVQGPLARSAADLEVALDVIAGPEPGEERWKLEIPAARQESLAGLRVAIMPQLDWLPVDDEIVAGIEEMARFLSRSGATVEVTEPEGFDMREQHRLYTALLSLMMFADVPPAAREKLAAAARRNDPEFGESQARGMLAGYLDYSLVLREREAFRGLWRRFFTSWDVLVAPIIIVPAFEYDTRDFGRRTLNINGQVVSYGRQTVYPGLATLPGHPATAFPIGQTAAGLPIGLQAIGPYLEDRTPIRFASLLEREYYAFTPPPRYA